MARPSSDSAPCIGATRWAVTHGSKISPSGKCTVGKMRLVRVVTASGSRHPSQGTTYSPCTLCVSTAGAVAAHRVVNAPLAFDRKNGVAQASANAPARPKNGGKQCPLVRKRSFLMSPGCTQLTRTFFVVFRSAMPSVSPAWIGGAGNFGMLASSCLVKSSREAAADAAREVRARAARAPHAPGLRRREPRPAPRGRRPRGRQRLQLALESGQLADARRRAARSAERRTPAHLPPAPRLLFHGELQGPRRPTRSLSAPFEILPRPPTASSSRAPPPPRFRAGRGDRGSKLI